jgi:aarF domain-containing kinase
LWSGATGAAALTPLGFVALGNNEFENGGLTQEEAMLAASRKELDEQVPKALKNSKKYRRGIYFFIDIYIFEPIMTGLRFLHLVFIFTPVLVTIPVIWFGKRHPDRDNERSGTLWWYGFLVRSMERAGAAFIKVAHIHFCHVYGLTVFSLVNGLPRAQTSSPQKCALPCQPSIRTRQPTP